VLYGIGWVFVSGEPFSGGYDVKQTYPLPDT
jgi:hypothetical protein